MSRYIDADNLEEKKFVGAETHGQGEHIAYRVGWNDAIEAICENEPTIDIVRCKECKYWDVDWLTAEQDDDVHWCSWKDLVEYGDWFCADGERKESE